jgi:hypothetical protein
LRVAQTERFLRGTARYHEIMDRVANFRVFCRAWGARDPPLAWEAKKRRIADTVRASQRRWGQPTSTATASLSTAVERSRIF